MELTFNLTEAEAQLIINALVKEPYGVVFDVIKNLQLQAKEQIEEKRRENVLSSRN